MEPSFVKQLSTGLSCFIKSLDSPVSQISSCHFLQLHLSRFDTPYLWVHGIFNYMLPYSAADFKDYRHADAFLRPT